MVRNVMRVFDVSLEDHDWVQKWCVDMHNIDSSINLSGRCLLEISKVHIQEISKFRFHLWELIWYFKKCKAPGSLGNQKDFWYLYTPQEK